MGLMRYSYLECILLTSPFEEKPIDEIESTETYPWHEHEWTGEEVAFAAEYLRTGSAARAHRAAFPKNYVDGTSKKNPHNHIHATFSAQKVLAEPWMQGYIAAIRAELVKRMAVTKENVLTELSKLAFSNMVDFYEIGRDGDPIIDLSGLSHEQAAALSEMTVNTYMDGNGDDAREVKSVRIKLAPKVAPLELLGKHFKLFTDVIMDDTPGDIADVIQKRRAERAARRKAEADKTDQDDETHDKDNQDE